MTARRKFQNEDLVGKGQVTKDEKTNGYDWKMEMRSWSLSTRGNKKNEGQ